MPDDRPVSIEPASDRWAAFLRDCLAGLILVGIVVWLADVGLTAIVSGHLDLTHSARLSHRWFLKPLAGLPAVLAGCSFLCLAVTFVSIGATHPRIEARLPSWTRGLYWWFFGGWAALYLAARFLA